MLLCRYPHAPLKKSIPQCRIVDSVTVQVNLLQVKLTSDSEQTSSLRIGKTISAHKAYSYSLHKSMKDIMPVIECYQHASK